MKKLLRMGFSRVPTFSWELPSASRSRYVPHQPRPGGLGELKRLVDLKGSPKIQQASVFDLAADQNMRHMARGFRSVSVPYF